jgi:uncharacterized membrane protein YfcA
MNTALVVNGAGSIILTAVAIFCWRWRHRLKPKQRWQNLLVVVICGCILGAIVSVLEVGWLPQHPYQDWINLLFDGSLTALGFYYWRHSLYRERQILMWIFAGSLFLLLTNISFALGM